MQTLPAAWCPTVAATHTPLWPTERGYPGYKRGNRYDNIASVVSPEMNADIIAAAVHILGQNQ